MTMTTLPITLCDNYVRISSSGGAGTGEAPVIVTPPSNVTKAIGEQATFSVAATGTPTLHYTWKKNAALITGAPDSASYTTPPVVAGDDGSFYQCLVSNAYGNTLSLSGTLTVGAGTTAPSIVTHPLDQSVTTGSAVTFTVTASGSATLTYQWYKAPDGTAAGAAISGATSSSYTDTDCQSGDQGFYYCVVTNGFGTATSNRAQLTVGAAGTDVLIVVPAATTILFSAEPCTVLITDPAAMSAVPTLEILGPSTTLSTSLGCTTTENSFSSTLQTVQQNRTSLGTKAVEYWDVYGFVDPGYTAAPTLSVRVNSCAIPGLTGSDYVRIYLYYGTTLISTMKTYTGISVVSETFPQVVTAVLNTNGSYPTYAAVMAALKVRIEIYGKAGQITNLVANFAPFETLGS